MEMAPPQIGRALVVIVDDRVSHGEREDVTGPLVTELLEEAGLLVDGVVVVPGDTQISSVHCRIECGPTPDSWQVVDLSSTNGTMVGGQRITTMVLRDGDRIHVGETVLKFCFHDELEEEFHRQVDSLMNIDDLTGLPVQRVFQGRFYEALMTCMRRSRRSSPSAPGAR